MHVDDPKVDLKGHRSKVKVTSSRLANIKKRLIKEVAHF